jgi:hypothetical protein
MIESCLVAGQHGDDLHGDRGHAFERIGGQVGGVTAAITTIMVSPIARLMAASRPRQCREGLREEALYEWFRLLVAPIARLPSRMALGTAAMLSSAIDETNGNDHHAHDEASGQRAFVRCAG